MMCLEKHRGVFIQTPRRFDSNAEAFHPERVYLPLVKGARGMSRSHASSGTKRTKSEHITVFGFASLSGPDGSRTRVRSPIPCTSTSLVYRLTFPPAAGDRHPTTFSSFMIRPHTQSLACVVSYLVDARFSKNRYKESDSCN